MIISEGYTLPPGTVVEGFQIIRLIGQGGYGDIYAVKMVGGSKQYAMKIENLESQRHGLANEIYVLRKLQSSNLFAKIITYGKNEDCIYLIMDLFGASLSNTRRNSRDHKIQSGTIVRLAYYMLLCIEDFHKHGFIHRDIKPSNFLLRPSSNCPLVLIDFGLSKDYINNETGDLLMQRPSSGFKGTVKYASINAHNNKDLSRRDDLISWMYSLVELTNGYLLWSRENDNDIAKEMKCNTTDWQLFEGMPVQYISIWRYINRLEYYEEPNYFLIKECLASIMLDLGVTAKSPFDWETMEQDKIFKISPLGIMPKGEEMNDIQIQVRPGNAAQKELDGVFCNIC